MIEPAKPLFRIMPIALVLIGVLQIVFGFVELRITGGSLALYEFPVYERWVFANATVNVLADGLWTIGFAAIVAVASRLLDAGARD